MSNWLSKLLGIHHFLEDDDTELELTTDTLKEGSSISFTQDPTTGVVSINAAAGAALTPPTDPTHDGRPVVANGGDLTYPLDLDLPGALSTVGDTDIGAEVSIEGGTSYTYSESFSTSDATPVDVGIINPVPINKNGVYDVTVWASGVVATGATCVLIRRSLFSVNDDGSVETRVSDDIVGTQYDGITVGGLSVAEDGSTPAYIRALITGKAATTIAWSVKVDVAKHLEAT